MKNPHSQTKSVLLKNLKAAASSKNPITTFVEFNQLPDLGRFDRYCGNKAKKKKGDAKAVLKTIIPIIGQNHCPWDAATSKRPTNCTVQVKLVRVKVTAIKIVPIFPSLPSCLRENCLIPYGKSISYIPNKENAK